MKKFYSKVQTSCRPINLLVVLAIFTTLCILLSLIGHKIKFSFLPNSHAENRNIDVIKDKPSELENPVASGFVFHDLSLPAWAKGFQMPVEGASIPKKEDQLPAALRVYRNGKHEGVDIFCAYGTPIMAAKDGYVLSIGGDYHELTKAFRDRLLGIAHKLASTPAEVLDILHGRRIILDHGYSDGRWVITVYSHLSEVKDSLEPGDFIKQGTIIGYAGNSGTSQAGTTRDSELHFEIRVNDHFLGEGMNQQEAGKLYSAVINGGKNDLTRN